MPTIKNHLTEIVQLNEKKMVKLLKHTEDNYRVDTANTLYNQLLHVPRKEIGSDHFIELVYETLKVWNMDSRGAKLSDFKIFKNSLQKNNEIIQGLTKLRIEKLKETDNQLKEKIDFLFNNLQLVAENKPPLVTFSKTMHFFLPNLFMPIDRKFTLPFFYRKAPFNPKNHVPFSKDHQSQIQIFCDIFEQFRQFANKHRSSLETQINPNSRWNRNIPKIIDNIIIAYVINNTIK